MEMSDDNNQALIDWLTKREVLARAGLATFIERLKAEPGRALDGCGGAFEMAAENDVATYALHELAHGASLDDLKKEAIAKVVDKARHPPQSTSETGNLFQRCKAKAWADFVHAIELRGGR
jgi:hypothetical protein